MGLDNQEGANIRASQTGVEAFVCELATYYMDFLETDFHKRRLPKRSIRYHDDKGLFLGLNAGKYDGFEQKVWKATDEGFKKDGHLTVRRGQYTTRVPSQILDLVKRQVEGIGDQEIQHILTFAADAIRTEATKHKTEADIALREAMERIHKSVRDVLVNPLLQHVEKPIRSQSSSGIESILTIEEGLTEAIVSFVEDTVSECVNRIIAGQQCDVHSELGGRFNLDSVRAKMKGFFAGLAINDLYFELQELVDNNHILDKTEIYIYFTDVQYDNNIYPVFYVPLTVEKQGDLFSVALDSSVYINKKALEYIVQEFNRETGRHGRIATIKQRILYPREYESGFLRVIQKVADEIADCFQLPEKLDLQKSQRQVVRGAAVRLSNSCHLCIFDKSDEALVNDYEEILEALASSDHPLREIFNELVRAFIKEEPVRVRQEIQTEWDKAELSDRLVYSSPIPVNAEQRQILKAVRNERCRYIAVEGPPGTGKSHTITAIVFDAIRDGRSVLVLSDKKEALDVVEEKITETMNRVRVVENFQNPILRLGRSGNTYSQILSGSSINNIERSYRAVKNNLGDLRSNIEERKARLQGWIRQTANIYGSISIQDIFRFVQLERVWGGESECPLCVDEFAEGKDSVEILENFKAASDHVAATLEKERAWGSIGKLVSELASEKQGLRELKGVVELLSVISLLRERHESALSVLQVFETIKDADYDVLVALVRECESLGSGWLGFAFKGRSLRELNERFNQRLECREFVDVRRSLTGLKTLIRILDDAKKEGTRELVSALFRGRADYFQRVHKLLCRSDFDLHTPDLNALLESIEMIEDFAEICPETAMKVGLSVDSAVTISSNKLSQLDEDSLASLVSFIALRSDTVEKFNSLPRFDYRRNLEELEELLTHEMTYLLDDRLLNFHENNRATAMTLRDNIRQKRRFPRKEFGKLKEAFPCIIAGIRDYAEYIPLEPGIFDLVVIDEASQVSIAQAFPALIRAKKVVVLGDKNSLAMSSRLRHGRTRIGIGSIDSKSVSDRTSQATQLSYRGCKNSTSRHRS